jgi:conjugal transfer pilus assembly protein TraU
VHVYHFPLLQWIGSPLLGGSCQSTGNFEIVYLSELDPTWRNENLALIAFPETKSFLNPITALGAQAACLLDSAIANTTLPDDKAFWCAGSQGLMYPLTGKVVEQVGPLQATTLLAERVLFKLHRLGQIKDTDCHQLCREQWLPIMPKSRYRYQLVYPHVGSCQPFGRTTSVWGSFMMNPLDSDDMSYLIWRKRNCCHWATEWEKE